VVKGKLKVKTGMKSLTNLKLDLTHSIICIQKNNISVYQSKFKWKGYKMTYFATFLYIFLLIMIMMIIIIIVVVITFTIFYIVKWLVLYPAFMWGGGSYSVVPVTKY
jgi:hypothetical protein